MQGEGHCVTVSHRVPPAECRMNQSVSSDFGSFTKYLLKCESRSCCVARVARRAIVRAAGGRGSGAVRTATSTPAARTITRTTGVRAVVYGAVRAERATFSNDGVDNTNT